MGRIRFNLSGYVATLVILLISNNAFAGDKCSDILSKNSSEQELRQLMIDYYRTQINENPLADKIPQPDYVGTFENSLIFTQDNMIHIGRQKNLGSTEVISISVPGAEIIEQTSYGKWVVLRTRSGKDEYFSVYDKTNLNTEPQVYKLKPNQKVEALEDSQLKTNMFIVGSRIVKIPRTGANDVTVIETAGKDQIEVVQTFVNDSNQLILELKHSGKILEEDSDNVAVSVNRSIVAFSESTYQVITSYDAKNMKLSYKAERNTSTKRGSSTVFVLVDNKEKVTNYISFTRKPGVSGLIANVELPGVLDANSDFEEMDAELGGNKVLKVQLRNKKRGLFDVLFFAPNHLQNRSARGEVDFSSGDDPILVGGEIAFADKDSDFLIIEASGGKADGKSTRNDGFVYHVINRKKQSKSFKFTSDLKLNDISLEFDGTKLPFFVGKVNEAKENSAVLISPESEEVVWMNELHKVEKVKTPNGERVVIWGEKEISRMSHAGLLMFDAEANSFKLAAYRGEKSGEGIKDEPSDFVIDIPDKLAMQSFGIPAGVKDWDSEVLTVGKEYFYRVSTVNHITNKQVEFLINMNSFAVTALIGSVDETESRMKVKYNGLTAKGVKPRLFVADEVKRNYEFDDSKPLEGSEDWFMDKWMEIFNGGSRDGAVDSQHLLIMTPGTPSGSKPGAVFSFEIDGRIDDLVFYYPKGPAATNSFYVEARSVIEDMEGEIPVLTKWESENGGEGKIINKLVNVLSKPLYSDKNIVLLGTKSTHNSDPKVYLFEKDKNGQLSFFGKEIRLKVELENQDDKDPEELVEEFFDDFLRWIFNLGPKSALLENRNEIAEIRREGNFLFVKTAESVNSASLTFIYDLNSNKIVTTIPNFVGVAEVGGYRFFVGEADHFYPATVSVFTAASNKYVTFFDFGKVNIDVSSKNFISKKGDQFLFKTVDGSTRVFDAKQRYFLGTVPPKLLGLIKKQVDSVGTIMNTQIFQRENEAFSEQGDFSKKLRATFPLTPSTKGSRRLMLVGERGVGVTHSIEDYIASYIKGELSPKPAYRAIFLKLDPGTIESDTMYRGQKAQKYRQIAELATLLNSFGYRLVIVLEGIHTFKIDNKGWDTEGDIFSNLGGLISGDSFDVIGTITPSGRDLLTRRVPDFYELFDNRLTLDPMSKDSALSSLKTYVEAAGLEEHLPEKTLIYVVERVKRLSLIRKLPGSAFDIIKGVVADLKVELASNKRVSPDEIRRRVELVIAEKTGVPTVLMGGQDSLAKTREDFVKYLKSKVKGQDHAIPDVVNPLLAFALGINRGDWPISRVFAAGPTGTGKTELIVAVTEYLFGSQEPRLKISGEDWKKPGMTDQIKELIVQHIFRNPFNIIHFDEFEKMHPDNQQVVLSVLDGEVTDANGKKVYTNMSFTYFTSNVGVSKLKEHIRAERTGFSNQTAADEIFDIPLEALTGLYNEAMREFFLPEVYNRFDKIVVFNFLVKTVAREITLDYLNGKKGSKHESIKDRFEKMGFNIKFDKTVVEYALENFVDYSMGARRLVIRLENFLIDDFITPAIAEGELVSGQSYTVFVKDGELHLK